ncbi:hypothetical protein KGY79_13585, partial [Candidatus Bipolaricaulota bacterium]|nr:hypothetical protein [Candidatus Bipolaricaulota bacterium]
GKIKLKLVFTKSFKSDYQDLPDEVQDRVDKQLKFLLEDLRYPYIELPQFKVKAFLSILTGMAGNEAL